jgi:hypothetical protein
MASCVVAFATPLGAQRVVPMTTADAAAKARAVVVAKVIDVSVRDEDGIYTYVDFQTLDTAKGTVPARFTYRMLGGRIGDREVRGGDQMPSFAAGQEVVVFLGPEVAAGGYPTLFWQHVYRVSASPSGTRTVTPQPTGLDLAAAPARSGPVNTSGPARLDDFLSALRRVK